MESHAGEWGASTSSFGRENGAFRGRGRGDRGGSSRGGRGGFVPHSLVDGRVIDCGPVGDLVEQEEAERLFPPPV